MILDLSGFGFSFNEKGCSYLCKCKDCTYPFFAAKNSFRCYCCATDALLADQWEKRRKGKSGEEAPDSDLRATLIKGASIIKDLAEANARADSAESQLSALRAENERLRKALERGVSSLDECVRVLAFAFEGGALASDTVSGLCVDPYGLLSDAKENLRHLRSELEAGHE